MKGFGRLSLHTWTVDTTPLATALDAARSAGYDAVELRRIDFKRLLDAGHSNAQILDLIRNSGIKVGILGVEYGWLFAKGEESKRLFGVLRETCKNAVALGCDMLMCAPGQIAAPISEAIVNLRTGADIVSEFSSLRLAIEFNSQHEVLNNVHALGELLAGAGRKNCGYLLDAYHLTRSGSPGRGFEDVPGEEIFVFQYSDVPPQQVAAGVKRPTDRLPPGKGTVRWREMLGLLAEKGYTGYLSYEAPNPELWARSPYEVAKEGVELTRKLLQDAVPSYAA
jgi:sugar phosphate isomerase/epimerase